MSQVVILNSGGEQVLGTVDLMHAIRMLNRRVARVFEAVPGQRFGPHPWPRSVELIRWIYAKWVYEATGAPVLSRENILRRDNYTCGYCGRTGTTYDHIVPRHLGGKTSWLNCVAACADCNNRRKGGKTLAQSGMVLQIVPYVPTVAQLRPRRHR